MALIALIVCNPSSSMSSLRIADHLRSPSGATRRRTYLSDGSGAQLVGAFFNGAVLFALGISVFLQSLQRFISLEGRSKSTGGSRAWGCPLNCLAAIENPQLVLIMGGVGFLLNLISVAFLHGKFALSLEAGVCTVG